MNDLLSSLLLSLLSILVPLAVAAPPQPWVTETALATTTDIVTDILYQTTSVAPQDPADTSSPWFCSGCVPVTRTLTFKPTSSRMTGTPFAPTDECVPESSIDSPPVVNCGGDWRCDGDRYTLKEDCDIAVKSIDPKATYSNPGAHDKKLTRDMGVWAGNCAVFAYSPNFKGCHLTGEELLVRYYDIRKYCQYCGALDMVGKDQHCAVVIDFIKR